MLLFSVLHNIVTGNRFHGNTLHGNTATGNSLHGNIVIGDSFHGNSLMAKSCLVYESETWQWTLIEILSTHVWWEDMYNAANDLILPFLCVLTDTGCTTLELLSDEIFVKLKCKLI